MERHAENLQFRPPASLGVGGTAQIESKDSRYNPTHLQVKVLRWKAI